MMACAPGRWASVPLLIRPGSPQRLANWASDVEKLQAQLAAEQQRLEQRGRQLSTEIETRFDKETERLQAVIDEHRIAV